MAHRSLIAALLIAFSVQAEGRFGGRGQVVPLGSISFQHLGGNGLDANVLNLLPGALWFAADNVAIGGSVGYAHAWGNGISGGHILIVNPQVAIAIPMGDRAALFPRIGPQTTTVWNGGSSTFFSIRGFAPVLLLPASHFYIGFGPQFEVIAAGTPSGQWLLGMMSEIGGYF
jgi:hypothetical protein